MAKQILMTGEKESFMTRVLANKLLAEGIQVVFVPWSVTGINSKWFGTSLVTLCIDEGVRPGDDVMHFLKDKMSGDGIKMIAVGDPEDIQFVYDNMPRELVYKGFARPVSNDEFVRSVVELFSKVDAGEFRNSILIVDDDPSYLSLVREWLKDKYKVFMVNSGMQAIKWLGSNKPDLILLDYEMPVTSGAQVLEMLRTDEDTKNIPVIFLTGKKDRESVMTVLSLKPDGYFLKSIERRELLERLQEFFVLHKFKN